MSFKEVDLEDIIFGTETNKLFDAGLPIDDQRYRQVKIGGYGIADIVSFRKPNYNKKFKQFDFPPLISVFELKNRKLSSNDFFQALRYKKGICRWMENRISDNKKRADHFLNIYIEPQFDITQMFPLINICLIGKGFDHDITNLDVLDLVSVYSFEYTVDGIKFNQINGYSLKNEKF